MADDADVMEIERMGPGPTERADIAAMLDAIGGAANATLLDSSEGKPGVPEERFARWLV
jgi:hypothetical protein